MFSNAEISIQTFQPNNVQTTNSDPYANPKLKNIQIKSLQVLASSQRYASLSLQDYVSFHQVSRPFFSVILASSPLFPFSSTLLLPSHCFLPPPPPEVLTLMDDANPEP
ncbi:hypothetical protein Hanom_Chr06g00544581 [Helianthus anomalus]